MGGGGRRGGGRRREEGGRRRKGGGGEEEGREEEKGVKLTLQAVIAHLYHLANYSVQSLGCMDNQ